MLEELGDCCASCPITNSIVAIVVMELVNGGHAQETLTYMDHDCEDASIALRLAFGSIDISNGSGAVSTEP